MSTTKYAWKTVFLLLFVVGSGSALWAQQPKPARVASLPTDVAQCVPDTAEFYMEIRDMTGFVEAFRSSELGRVFQEVEPLAAIEEMVHGALRLGTFTVLGMPLSELNDGHIKSVCFFINGVSPRRLQRRRPRREPTFIVQVSPEVRKRVMEMAPKPRRKRLVSLGDILIVGPPRSAQAALRSAKSGDCLADLPSFVDCRERLAPKQGIFFWANITPTVTLLRRRIETRNPREFRNQKFVGTFSIKSVGGSLGFRDGRVHDRLFITDGGERQGLIGLLETRKAIVFKTPEIFPNDTLVWVGASITSGDDLYQSIENVIRQAHGDQGLAGFQEFIQFMEQQWKIAIREDLMGAIGGEWAMGLISSGMGDLIKARRPNPLNVPAVFALEIKDKQALQDVIDQILISQWGVNLGLASDDYDVEDVTIHTIVSAKNPRFVFTYAFIGNEMVMALNPKFVEDTVRKFKAGKNLGSSEKFKQSWARLASGKHQVRAYVDLSALGQFVLKKAEKTPGKRQVKAMIMPSLHMVAKRLGSLVVTCQATPGGMMIESESLTGGAFWLGALLSFAAVAQK